MLTTTLLKHFNLLEFLRTKGYTYSFIGGKTQYLLDRCPFCGKDYHLGFSPENQFFGCFRCQEKGSTVKLIQKILNVSFIEVLKLLKEGVVDDRHINIEYVGGLFDNLKEYETLASRIKPIPMPEGYMSLGNVRIPYLDQRKITQEQVKYYKMGVCLTGRYKDRLIICDVDEQQQPIYWIARDITGRAPKNKKVLNPAITPENKLGSGDILFNFSLAKNYDVGIITEGIFDALWIGNNALATYSKGLKEFHLYWLLQSNFKEIILMYDPDVSDKELEKNASILAQVFPTRICKLTKGDPDEHTKEELQVLISQAPLFTPTRLTKTNLELDEQLV